jgi:hypothetical protein
VVPEFAGLANLTPYVKGALNRAHVPVSRSVVSMGLLVITCIALRGLLRGDGISGTWGPIGFVNVCLMVVMLAAPITWVFNLVWLVPFALVMLFGPPTEGRCRAAAWAGFVLLMLPDAFVFPLMFPRVFGTWLLGGQYIAAVGLMLPYAVQVMRGRVDGGVMA